MILMSTQLRFLLATVILSYLKAANVHSGCTSSYVKVECTRMASESRDAWASMGVLRPVGRQRRGLSLCSCPRCLPSARFLALLFSLLRGFSYGGRTKTEYHAPRSRAGSWPLMLRLAISRSDHCL